VSAPHAFIVGASEPLRVPRITTPSGLEHFVADVGEPARQRRLPDPAPADPGAIARAAPSTPSNCSVSLRSTDPAISGRHVYPANGLTSLRYSALLGAVGYCAAFLGCGLGIHV
jgi:hypothetical protein